jgi:hypothetical protein
MTNDLMASRLLPLPPARSLNAFPETFLLRQSGPLL